MKKSYCLTIGLTFGCKYGNFKQYIHNSQESIKENNFMCGACMLLRTMNTKYTLFCMQTWNNEIAMEATRIFTSTLPGVSQVMMKSKLQNWHFSKTRWNCLSFPKAIKFQRNTVTTYLYLLCLNIKTHFMYIFRYS